MTATGRWSPFSDVFPATVPNTRWDPDASQLIVFTTTSLGPASTPIRSADRRETRSERGSAAPSLIQVERRLTPVPVKHNRRTIIVDAGHGGVDNGMTGPLGRGPRIYEKDITLAVASRLGHPLASRGVDVVYTRTTDTLIALDDR